mgnify:CR=1 FL=1
MKRLLLLLILIVVGLQAALAQEDVFRVDASTSLGTISPYVFGANMGHHALIPGALLDEAQALNLNFLRFGGGDSDQQDLRTSTLDIFVLQARAIGTEPLVTVRLLNGTPEAAAEMVRYANVEKGYNIRYWSIGNEPNLFVRVLGAPSYSTEDLVAQWRAIAEAMLAVDPEIMLVGPDITQYVVFDTDPMTYLEMSSGGHPRDDQGRDWLIEFLRANGDLVDIVSIHRYPFAGGGDRGATVEGLPAVSHEWDVAIPNLRQVIREAAGRDIPIAVTEFNSNSSQNIGGEASLDSLANAIWIGDVLGRLIRNQVEYATVWDIQGSPVRGWGLLGTYDVRPAYYSYLMYTHFGTELLASESSDPLVSISAALRDDGALTLMVVNLGRDEATKTLSLSGFVAGGDAEVWQFDAEHNAEALDAQAISDGTTITVPGLSMTVYVLPPQ